MTGMGANCLVRAGLSVPGEQERCTTTDEPGRELWDEHGWALTAPQTGALVACVLLGSAVLAGIG